MSQRSTLYQVLSAETTRGPGGVRRIGYFSSLLIAGVLLIAGLAIYGQARRRDQIRMVASWSDLVPVVAMAYGSLVLLAIAVIEIHVRHAQAGSLVLRTHTLDDLVTHLTREQEREREQLSIRLHDDLGGLLTALKLEIEVLGSGTCADAEQVQRVNRLFDRLFDEVRGMSALLYPRLIGSIGLRRALDEMVKRLGGGEVNVELATEGSFDGLDEEASLCVLRVVQEGLVNARRHAGAQRISIRVTNGPEGISGVVEDDGCGWDGIEEGMGLMLMRERVRRLGGRLEICASQAGGVCICFSIPSEVDL